MAGRGLTSSKMDRRIEIDGCYFLMNLTKFWVKIIFREVIQYALISLFHSLSSSLLSSLFLLILFSVCLSLFFLYFLFNCFILFYLKDPEKEGFKQWEIVEISLTISLILNERVKRWMSLSVSLKMKWSKWEWS